MGEGILLDDELDDMETDFRALLEPEPAPPEAFYLALKKALVQLEQTSSATWG